VTQRGNRRQQTFFHEEDCAASLALLGEWCGVVTSERADRSASRRSWIELKTSSDESSVPPNPAVSPNGRRSEYGVPQCIHTAYLSILYFDGLAPFPGRATDQQPQMNADERG
jgi:hypothetical protein